MQMLAPEYMYVFNIHAVNQWKTKEAVGFR